MAAPGESGPRQPVAAQFDATDHRCPPGRRIVPAGGQWAEAGATEPSRNSRARPYVPSSAGPTAAGERVSHPSPSPDPALRERLERAAEGLVYTSESDRPFEFFFLPGGGDQPPGPRAFARLLGAGEDARVEERDLYDFFARHAETSDPYDLEAQRIRPRYEALRELLRTALRGTTVYRLGKIEVACYVVGGDGRGNLAGLRTVAVET